MIEIDFVKKCLDNNKVNTKIELINFLKIEKDNKNDDNELSKFFEEYLTRTAKFSFQNINIMIGPNKGLSYLSAFFLLHYCRMKNKRERQKVLNYLLNFYYTLSTSQSPLLTITSARSLLKIVKDFGIRDSLLFKDWTIPLKYIFIPFECSEKNAEFSLFPHSITIFKPNLEKAFSAEYVFLHEIGHVIQVHFTNQGTMVPESFCQCFPNIKKQDYPEVFADFFTIAVMMDSKYSVKNPFIKPNNRISENKIKDYFHNLISYGE